MSFAIRAEGLLELAGRDHQLGVAETGQHLDQRPGLGVRRQHDGVAADHQGRAGIVPERTVFVEQAELAARFTLAGLRHAFFLVLGTLPIAH